MSERGRDWRSDGVRVVRQNQFDGNVVPAWAQRGFASLTHAPTGFDSLWAGAIEIEPGAQTGAHHHGPVDSILCIVSGRARVRWGDALEFTATAGPGDFIFVPPWVPHQETNASTTDPLNYVLVRSEQDAVVVDLDLPCSRSTGAAAWVDPNHPRR